MLSKITHWFKRIFRLAKNDANKIIAGVQQNVADLETLAATRLQEAADKIKQANDLVFSADALKAEAQRAKDVAGKIKALFS